MVVTVSPDDAAACAFLETLLGPKPDPNAVLRVCSNRPPRDGEGKGSWTEEPVPDVEAAAEYLARHRADAETYCALGWFVGGKLAENVVEKTSFGADVDLKDLPGATEQERRKRARDLVGAIPCPKVVVDSGHGFQVHVLVAKRDRVGTHVDPDDGRRGLAVYGRALRLFLEDKGFELFGTPVSLDHCHGAERVWRVPGGFNCKRGEGEKVLTADRSQWRPVELVAPGRPEGLAHLVAADLTFLIPFIAAAEAEQDEADAARNGAAHGRHTTATGREEEPPAFDVQLLPESLRHRWPLAGMNPSEADYVVALELAKAGHPEAVAEAAIRARREAAGDPGHKADRADYVGRTVDKAYRKAAAEKVAATTPPPGRPGSSRPRAAAPPPPPRKPFPIATLPPVVRRYVEECAAYLGCCPSLVALPVLVVLASAIGTTRRVILRGGAQPWAEPSVFWGAIVAESGQLKSPALDLAVSLLRYHERKAARENDELGRQHAKSLAQYERDAARFRRGKGDEPPEKPKRPPYRRFLVSDVTVEALADRLADNPRGLLVTRDELNGWLQSFDAYRAGSRGGDREKWLELHGARTLTVDRKSGDHPTIQIPLAASSVIGGIQPATLARALTTEFFESGFAARLLLTMPPAVQRRWTEAEVSHEALDGLARVLAYLLDLRHARDATGDPLPIDLPLTKEGKAAWIQFFNEHAAEGEGLDGRLAAAWSKAEGYAARFALVIHLVREAHGEAAPSSGVDAGDVAAGAELSRWFLAETERVYAVLGESPDVRAKRILTDWIRAHGGRVTARDLARGPRAFRGNEAAAEQALDGLVNAGWGTWEEAAPSEKGGRPTRRFVLRAEPAATSTSAPPPPETPPVPPPPDAAPGRERGSW
ncbi:MAG: DUF3987 domain-containing protein [Planctomycetes bacterium]|nr:DUF3987 domain-containing protein [Planctomycetota bacterium]